MLQIFGASRILQKVVNQLVSYNFISAAVSLYSLCGILCCEEVFDHYSITSVGQAMYLPMFFNSLRKKLRNETNSCQYLSSLCFYHSIMGIGSF